MSDIQKLIDLLHSYAWGEMTLTEQVELKEQAAAELAEMQVELELRRQATAKALDECAAKDEALQAAREAIEAVYEQGGLVLRGDRWDKVVEARMQLALLAALSTKVQP